MNKCFISGFFVAISACSYHNHGMKELKMDDKKTCDVTITSNEEVVIGLPNKHPKSFAVKSPNGKWYYVVDKNKPYSFYDPSEFERVERVSFKVSDLKGYSFQGSIEESINYVFNESGTYTFYMADNLDTEPDNTFFMSTVVCFEKN